MVQCEWVFCACRKGAGGSRHDFELMEGRAGASLKVSSNWHGNFHKRSRAPTSIGCGTMGGGEGLCEKRRELV